MSNKPDAPFWIRFLPSFLRVKIENRNNLHKIINNAGWLFFDKILRMGVGVIVSVWIARFLGPEQFGLLNYASALVAVFTSVATLGLNNIVVRDLVKSPDSVDSTLGTGFVLQLAGGGVAFLLALIAVAVMRPDDAMAKVIVAVIGLTMLFKASEIFKYWFESVVQSKFVVWVENGAFLVFAVVKVVLILNSAPLLWFVYSILLECVFASLMLVYVYVLQGGRIRLWQWRISRAKELLSDSWPLILSGFAAMIYMRIDQIMLGQMLGDKAVGIYSAAVRLSEVWYFIPMVITASVFPAIIEAKQNDESKYTQRLGKLYGLMVFLALAVALPISFSAGWIMDILYGAGYSDSAKILVIHVWTGVFVFLGVASSRWFVVENLQKYTFYRTLAGCLVNVCLNVVLIPEYGPVGAAFSSILSQAIASVFFNFFNSKTRPLFYMQMKAIFGFGILFNE